MKIAVIGASGNAGARITAELARRGHAVTAIARNPEKIARLANVIPTKGDASDEADLTQLLRGHDAAISSIHFLASDPTKLSQLAQIGLWEITQLAYFMNKMKSVTEGSSNLLYNSTIFFSSDISDGNRHNHDDMPIILAGHGGGALTPGKHVAFPTSMKQKVANLLVTMLGTAGVANATLGDSTGPLAGL